MIRRFPLLALAPLMVGSLAAAPAAAQTAPAATQPAATQPMSVEPAAQALLDRVLKAYKDTTVYAATTDFELRQKDGRWLRTQKTDFKVAFDRAGSKLLIDKPDVLIVVNDGKLRLKGADIAGRYLETDAPKPLDYAALSGEYFFIGQPPLPDMVLLLSGQPLHDLTAGNAKEIKAVAAKPADAAKRPGLQVSSGPVSMTLWVDPSSHLVTGMDLDLNAQARGGGASDSAVLSYEIKVTQHNAALAADAFKFDAAGGQAVGSLQELVGAPEIDPGGGGGPLDAPR